jgi:Pretoxin HINT domain
VEHYNQAFDAQVEKAEQERLAENARQAYFCAAENAPGTDEYKNCVHHLTDSDTVKLGKAMLNAELCSVFATPGSIYHTNCLYDSFNPNFGANLQLDIMSAYVSELLGIAVTMGDVTAGLLMAALYNAVCGTVVGLLGGAEATMGIGGLYDLWLTEQLANLAAGIGSGKMAYLGLRGLAAFRVPAVFQRLTGQSQSAKSLLGRFALGLQRCIVPNSFTAQTWVLLSNGVSKPISLVQPGEMVLATDPTTGETGPHPVTATVAGSGDKQLVDITVDAGGGTGTITATANHPFWVADLAQWVDAGQLQSGQMVAHQLRHMGPGRGRSPSR